MCGKDDEVAAIQDALVYALKGLALVAEKAAPAGVVPDDTYPFIEEGLFTTLTNVNFDPEALTDWVRETVDRRETLKAALAAKQPGVTFPEGPATFVAGVHLRRPSPTRAASTTSTPKPRPTRTSAPCSTPSSTASRASPPTPTTPPNSATATRPSTTTSSRRWPISPATTRATSTTGSARPCAAAR